MIVGHKSAENIGHQNIPKAGNDDLIPWCAPESRSTSKRHLKHRGHEF